MGWGFVNEMSPSWLGIRFSFLRPLWSSRHPEDTHRRMTANVYGVHAQACVKTPHHTFTFCSVGPSGPTEPTETP